MEIKVDQIQKKTDIIFLKIKIFLKDNLKNLTNLKKIKAELPRKKFVNFRLKKHKIKNLNF